MTRPGFGDFPKHQNSKGHPLSHDSNRKPSLKRSATPKAPPFGLAPQHSNMARVAELAESAAFRPQVPKKIWKDESFTQIISNIRNYTSIQMSCKRIPAKARSMYHSMIDEADYASLTKLPWTAKPKTWSVQAYSRSKALITLCLSEPQYQRWSSLFAVNRLGFARCQKAAVWGGRVHVFKSWDA